MSMVGPSLLTISFDRLSEAFDRLVYRRGRSTIGLRMFLFSSSFIRIVGDVEIPAENSLEKVHQFYVFHVISDRTMHLGG